jgi:zinc transport system substrate-binding protein
MPTTKLTSRPLARLTLTAAAGALLLSACSSTSTATSSPTSGGPVSVVAAFYPLEYAATSVGGDAVSVTTLTPPGVEPHDLELTAAQVAEIASADVVLYVKGFQPAVDEAVQQQAADRAIDVSDGLTLLAGTGEGEESAVDPHVWLAPLNMATIASTIGTRFAALNPAAADAIGTRTTEFGDSMSKLDARFTAGLAQCASRDLVVSHDAFGYLADAYDLSQIGISGLSPEAEPSPARLKEVAQLVRDTGITTIYHETLVDPKIAQTIADETGATSAVLDPLEGLAPDSTGDYLTVMDQNLATLQSGQSCT